MFFILYIQSGQRSYIITQGCSLCLAPHTCIPTAAYFHPYRIYYSTETFLFLLSVCKYIIDIYMILCYILFILTPFHEETIAYFFIISYSSSLVFRLCLERKLPMRTIIFYLCSLFLPFFCPVLLPAVPTSPTPTHSFLSDSAPVILQAALTSSNHNPLYAADNDLLTLRFTTELPCFLSPCHLPQESDAAEPALLYYNPSGDHRTFYCTMRIQPGLLPDQTILTPDDLLRFLFPNGYRYYGSGSGITYLAPIRLSYQLIPVSHTAATTYLLTVSSNHPVELIAPERVSADGKVLWSVSCIDAAANGPLCLTFFLEEDDVLLYNLVNERKQMIQEESYAGKSD